MSGSELRLVLDFAVTDLDTFTSAVRSAVEVSAGEPGTVHYDWYIDEEAGTARLYEAYESAEAVAAHVAGKVFTELLPVLASSSRITNIDAYGDPAVLGPAEALGPVKLWGEPFAAV